MASEDNLPDEVEETEVLCDCESWLEASEIESVLEAGGISCTIESNEDGALSSALTSQTGYGNIRVLEGDMTRARALLTSYLEAKQDAERLDTDDEGE